MTSVVLLPWMWGVLCAAIWCLFPILFWILGCLYQCLCHSFVGYLCWLCICSIFLMCFPFLCVLIIPMVSVMVLYFCPVFNMCFEYPELLLLFLIACICSLYLVWNVLLVCPMYLSGHFRHYLLTYGAEPFLRSCQLCSHSKTLNHAYGSMSIFECLLFLLLCRKSQYPIFPF
jgi:hypothetical protein